MFRVDRHEPGFVSAHGFRDNVSGNYQSLFIGECDAFSGLDRGECRSEAAVSDRGIDKRVKAIELHRVGYGVGSRRRLDSKRLKRVTQFPIVGSVGYYGPLRAIFDRLLNKGVDFCSGDQNRRPEHFGIMVDHIKSLNAD